MESFVKIKSTPIGVALLGSKTLKCQSNVKDVKFGEEKQLLPVNSRIQQIIADHILDMVDYGQDTKSDSCGIFARIAPVLHIAQNPRPLSIILDTATDSMGHGHLVVLCQTLENDEPKIYFYKLICMGADLTSDGFLRTLLKTFEQHKETHGIDLYAYFKNNLIGLGTYAVAVFYGFVSTGTGRCFGDFEADRGVGTTTATAMIAGFRKLRGKNRKKVGDEESGTAGDGDDQGLEDSEGAGNDVGGNDAGDEVEEEEL
ncbi:unnamed protein product [Allacma fusca]|uniref:Uncharacterized protein n=1 Tax=Allacma fusca TaxID=39272 RepID=A0A8J2PAQ0_9HEXA|nr:unnamed protein product [Allacma fusca]